MSIAASCHHSRDVRSKPLREEEKYFDRSLSIIFIVFLRSGDIVASWLQHYNSRRVIIERTMMAILGGGLAGMAIHASCVMRP